MICEVTVKNNKMVLVKPCLTLMLYARISCCGTSSLFSCRTSDVELVRGEVSLIPYVGECEALLGTCDLPVPGL